MKKTRILPLFAAAALFGGLAAAPAQAQDAAQLAAKKNCLACHAVDKKVVGPSYKDVAAKYAGQKDAVDKLAAKIMKGGSGVWGPVPMAPNPPDKISDADLQAAIQKILATT